MIFQLLADFASRILFGIIDFMSFTSIPTDAINAVRTIAVYGNYVIGADLMIIFFGMVTGWFAVKMSYHLVVFIWKMLPLT